MTLLPPEAPGPNPGQPGHFAHTDWLTASVKALDAGHQDQAEVLAAVEPLGRVVAPAIVTTPQTGFASSELLMTGLLCGPFQLPAGRLIRVTMEAQWGPVSAAGHLYMYIKEGATVLKEGVLGFSTAGYYSPLSLSVILRPGAGEHTYHGAAMFSGGGGIDLASSPINPSYILVEDIGAA